VTPRGSAPRRPPPGHELHPMAHREGAQDRERGLLSWIRRGLKSVFWIFFEAGGLPFRILNRNQTRVNPKWICCGEVLMWTNGLMGRRPDGRGWRGAVQDLIRTRHTPHRRSRCIRPRSCCWTTGTSTGAPMCLATVGRFVLVLYNLLLDEMERALTAENLDDQYLSLAYLGIQHTSHNTQFIFFGSKSVLGQA